MLSIEQLVGLAVIKVSNAGNICDKQDVKLYLRNVGGTDLDIDEALDKAVVGGYLDEFGHMLMTPSTGQPQDVADIARTLKLQNMVRSADPAIVDQLTLYYLTHDDPDEESD